MTMLRALRSLPAPFLLFGLLFLAAACQEEGPGAGWEGETLSGPLPPSGHAWVVFNGDTVVAEIADTPEARERGLMFRTELADGAGMIFVFQDVAPRSFWMRDTYVPLDIAFLDQNQVIVDIQAMEPEDEEFTESAAPAMFALEVRQGWFEEQGIDIGQEAEIVFGRR